MEYIFPLHRGNFGTTVWKRNERERLRVRCVNDGYERLRNHLPLTESDRRISKVDTLRLAIRYIRHLDALLQSYDHWINDRRISKVDTLRLAIRYIRHLDALLQSYDHWIKCDCFRTFQTESEERAERLRRIDRRKRALDSSSSSA
ncbi:unnamed protein product [Gongylonema pulchrum]|uniref:BHLH domain-containing protein n=1 Tax=Gongylonema pulchrum TaxID=637853 RepID=A0A183EJN8_9BILA|nr:unnamed protein product [Gongylonema pulchrum]